MNKNALYYRHPYVKEFDAYVVSCISLKKGYEVFLDTDGFYPEGGGQPCDHGTMDGIQVYDVQETNKGIAIHTEKPVKGRVHCVIDWKRRMRNTQNHSGEHIISGLVHAQYGYDNVGFHMETKSAKQSGVMTIDFNGALTWQQCLEIETKANQIIYENHPVHELWPSQEELKSLAYRSKKELNGDVRLIDFDGYDVCACCGTHVAYTGEIGLIKILNLEKHREGVRMELVCGQDAFAILQQEHNSINTLKRMLASSADKVVSSVQKVLDANNEEKKTISLLHQKLYAIKADAYKEEETILLFEEGLTPDETRNYCDYLIHHTKARLVCVCTKKSAETYQYVIASDILDLRKQIMIWNQTLHGRGGGQPEMVQGMFSCKKEEIIKTLKGETHE